MEWRYVYIVAQNDVVYIPRPPPAITAVWCLKKGSPRVVYILWRCVMKWTLYAGCGFTLKGGLMYTGCGTQRGAWYSIHRRTYTAAHSDRLSSSLLLLRSRLYNKHQANLYTTDAHLWYDMIRFQSCVLHSPTLALTTIRPHHTQSAKYNFHASYSTTTV